MKKKKININILLSIIITCIFLTGCSSDKTPNDINTSSEEKIKSTADLTENKGTLKCTREGTIENGTAAFSYEITHKNGNILVLHSKEGVTSDDKEILDVYKNAYENINKHYEELKYYDTTVKTTDNSVTRDTTINYDKIDLDALLDLEGAEDNIIKDGNAKLDLWLKLATKFGTTCKEV